MPGGEKCGVSTVSDEKKKSRPLPKALGAQTEGGGKQQPRVVPASLRLATNEPRACRLPPPGRHYVIHALISPLGGVDEIRVMNLRPKSPRLGDLGEGWGEGGVELKELVGRLFGAESDTGTSPLINRHEF